MPDAGVDILDILQFGFQESGKGSKKRPACSPSKRAVKKPLTDRRVLIPQYEWEELKKKYNGVGRILRVLTKDVKTNINTKVEIKKGAAALAQEADKVAALLDKINESVEEAEVDIVEENRLLKFALGEVRQEIAHLRKQDVQQKESLEEENPLLQGEIAQLRLALEGKTVELKSAKASSDTKNVGIQVVTAEPRRAEQCSVGTQTDSGEEDVVAEIKEELSYEEWKALAEKKWSKTAYKICELRNTGSPLDRREATKIVWIDRADPDMEKGMQRAFREKYPQLQGIDEEFESIDIITKYGSGKCSGSERVVRIDVDGDEGKMWKYLQKVKSDTPDQEILATHAPGGVEFTRMGKMLEAVFWGRGNKIILHVKRKSIEDPKPKRTRDRKSYALIVEQEGNTYKQLLGTIKTAVNSTAANASIQNIRSTRDGKVLITLDKNEEASTKIREAIEGAKDGISIRSMGDHSKETLFIRGTKDDILKGIEEKTGPLSKGRLKIGDPRPSANNTCTATIMVGKAECEALETAGRLRIGVVTCRIQKKVNVVRCFKCWEFDHMARDCKGADRSRNCRKCGEEGHRAVDCEKEEACPICSDRGHMAGSFRCGAFRRSLEQARAKLQKYPREDC